MGLLLPGLKKLDLRLHDEGEGGICDNVSMVLSDNEGLGFRFSLGVSGCWTGGPDMPSRTSSPLADNSASSFPASSGIAT